jgi:branched-subunit amino acid ABC-type transport system permease component
MNSLITDLAQEIFSGIALGSIYALIALGFILIFKALDLQQLEVMMQQIQYYLCIQN